MKKILLIYVNSDDNRTKEEIAKALHDTEIIISKSGKITSQNLDTILSVVSQLTN